MMADRSPTPAPGMSAPVRAGETAVVVGLGASGLAAARLLAALGARVRLLDRNPDAPEAARDLARGAGMDIITGEHLPEHFAGAALAVTSPGVPITLLAPLLARAGNPPLMAEMELALRYAAEPILAVTGTSGKTTTVTLAAAMLRAAGKRVFLGGNVGTPLSEYVLAQEKADALVLELSSFQLQGLEHLKPKAAAMLNLAPNHLDHHKDMDEYREAKFRIFARQTPDDLALLPEGDEDLRAEYARRGCAARLTFFGPTERFADSPLAGAHNRANAEAAFLACREFGVSEADAARAVAAFQPLPHRLEKVGELRGVVYVNDSKSTTVDSLRAALKSFAPPVYLLAGGKFKGGDLESLRDLLRERVRAVALFGASREIFEKAWQGTVPLSWDATLPEATARLAALAERGGAVLLSPATSSFDLYGNYMERGDHFRRVVADMIAEQGDARP